MKHCDGGISAVLSGWHLPDVWLLHWEFLGHSLKGDRTFVVETGQERKEGCLYVIEKVETELVFYDQL